MRCVVRRSLPRAQRLCIGSNLCHVLLLPSPHFLLGALPRGRRLMGPNLMQL